MSDKGQLRGVNPRASPLHRLRERLSDTLHAVRAHPTGRVALKVTVALLGAVVVGVGVVLIPLPGPGWALVLLGLAIWAVEFVWAKHLLRYTRYRVHRWTRWAAGQSLPVRLLLGAVGLAFVAAVATVSLKVGLGIDLLGEGWRYITTH